MLPQQSTSDATSFLQGAAPVQSTDSPQVAAGAPLYGTLSLADGGSVAVGGDTTGGTTGGTAPAPVDPYTTQQHTLLNALPGQLGVISSTAGDAANTAAGNYKTSILDFLDKLKLQQMGINNQSVQNELARRQGMQGILGMVGRGIQSGGIQLANRNAGDSSASEALARAYGTLGKQQQLGINTQYNAGQNALQNAQDAYNLQAAGGVRDLQSGKNTMADQIVQAAQQQLAQLDSYLTYADLPGRIDIQAQKDAIRQKAMDALGALDAQLTQGVSSIQPTSQEDARIKAQQLATSGVGPTSPFNYTTSIPAQFSGTGDFSSSLPIFTLPSRSKQTV